MSRSALWRQEGNVKDRERQAEELFNLAVEEGRVRMGATSILFPYRWVLVVCWHLVFSIASPRTIVPKIWFQCGDRMIPFIWTRCFSKTSSSHPTFRSVVEISQIGTPWWIKYTTMWSMSNHGLRVSKVCLFFCVSCVFRANVSNVSWKFYIAKGTWGQCSTSCRTTWQRA